MRQQEPMPDIRDITDLLPRDPLSPYLTTRPVGAIKLIVVHHDAVWASPRGGYDAVARYSAQAGYHMAKNWSANPRAVVRGFGLMYHYRVDTQGNIYKTQPEELLTWHARGANGSGLAVCCDLGAGQSPTAGQLAGLERLLDWLCYARPDIPVGQGDVWGHGELGRLGNSTECPGGRLRAWVKAYRENAAG